MLFLDGKVQHHTHTCCSFEGGEEVKRKTNPLFNQLTDMINNLFVEET